MSRVVALLEEDMPSWSQASYLPLPAHYSLLVHPSITGPAAAECAMVGSAEPLRPEQK